MMVGTLFTSLRPRIMPGKKLAHITTLPARNQTRASAGAAGPRLKLPATVSIAALDDQLLAADAPVPVRHSVSRPATQSCTCWRRPVVYSGTWTAKGTPARQMKMPGPGTGLPGRDHNCRRNFMSGSTSPRTRTVGLRRRQQEAPCRGFRLGCGSSGSTSGNTSLGRGLLRPMGGRTENCDACLVYLVDMKCAVAIVGLRSTTSRAVWASENQEISSNFGVLA
jgi:hypothetical protein